MPMPMPMLMLATKLEVICSIAAIGNKGGAQPAHSQSVRLRAHEGLICFAGSVSGTYRVKDVVIVTPHTAGVLVAVVRIGEPL
jgi:hypothetical protein